MDMKFWTHLRKSIVIFTALLFSLGSAGSVFGQGPVILNAAPVVRVRVVGEFNLPPYDKLGHAILDSAAPSHLEPFQYVFPGYSNYWHYVLVPGTVFDPFVVDASGTTDAEGDPLSFSWSYYLGNDVGDVYALTPSGDAASPYYTNHPPYLNNVTSRQMIVEVSDGTNTTRVWFGVQVITPQALCDVMLDWLDQRYNNPRGPAQQKLIPALRRVTAKFADGDTAAARKELRRFRGQVRLYGTYQGAGVTRMLLKLSQSLLDTTREVK